MAKKKATRDFIGCAIFFLLSPLDIL